MAIASTERAVFGQAFDPVERFVLGFAGGVAAVAHAALVLAALTFLYVLLAL